MTALRYYVEDFLGSSRVMTAAADRSVCYDADFLPFGQERIAVNNCAQNYKFSGKERDTETGNDDFGARSYSSSMGRWLSADWSAIPAPAPVPYANLSNPQTLNLYAYVGNNPLSRRDPDGHYLCTGSKEQCGAIKTALDAVKKADANLKVGTAARIRLDKVLSFYGAEGQKNGVDVNFADLGGKAFGETFTKDKTTTITFDTGAMKSAFGAAGAAETVAHEGTHGVDQRRVGMASTFWTAYDTEYHAYQRESYIDKGLGLRTESDGDRPVWAPTMSNTQRVRSITRNAYDNAKADCQSGGCSQ